MLTIAWVVGCNRVQTDGFPRAAGPSVLLVTIDTLRADHVGVYGATFSRTPRLDALANRGARFDQAMATAPLTLPSHASIFTGLYPPAHGVRHNGVFRLGSELTTMTERFRDAGWQTGAVVGAAVLKKQFGIDQGFDYYDADIVGDRATPGGFAERRADVVTDLALEWVRGVDGPFFLWVHYYDVHAKYDAPEPFRSDFAKRPYDGEVAFVDSELGRLLDGFEALGKLSHTLVAVTSDHGEGLGEHGEGTHTYFVYDSDLHVPLVIAGPGVPEGVVVDEVVSNAALAPTLVSLAGLEPLPSTDVGDLSLLWQGGVGPGWAYAESLAGELDHGWAQLRAIRSATHHFISAPRPELFDQEADPRQQVNLLDEGDPVEIVGEARARLSEASVRETEAKIGEIDAETRAQIEALGYVVPSGAIERTGADPKDVFRYARYGFSSLALYFQGEYEKAGEVAEAGLEHLPNSPSLNDMLARVNFELGKPQVALGYAERAAELNPHSAEIHANLAFLRLISRDREGALEAFSNALKVDPKHVGAHLGLMWRATLGGSVEEAERHGELAFELGPGRPAVFETAGDIWEQLGEYERALDAYERGAKLHPESGRLQMRLAIQFARLQDEERSLRHLSQAGSEAENIELKSHLGVIYAAGGDAERGERIFREVMADHPGAIRPTAFLAHLLRTTGREAEAEALDVKPLPLPVPPVGEIIGAPAHG